MNIIIGLKSGIHRLSNSAWELFNKNIIGESEMVTFKLWSAFELTRVVSF